MWSSISGWKSKSTRNQSLSFQVPSGERLNSNNGGQNEYSGREERRGDRAERRLGERAGERRRDELHEREGHLRATHHGARRRLLVGLRALLRLLFRHRLRVLRVGGRRRREEDGSALVHDEFGAERDAQRVWERERGLQRHEAHQRRRQERAQEAERVYKQSET